MFIPLNIVKKLFLFLFLTSSTYILTAQVAKDLRESVPAWLEIDSSSNQALLKWMHDDNANQYQVSEIDFEPNLITSLITNVEGDVDSVNLGELTPGMLQAYHIRKYSNDAGAVGIGIIGAGIEIETTHSRGRCLIAIDDTLVVPLKDEIAQLINDLEMDGWQVDTLQIKREENDVMVKAKIISWYDYNNSLSQALFILGHVAVPYSGNSAYDGHSNHQGAWAADVFYGEVNGNWTDQTVNNITPSRDANKNIPGDGKYDQTYIPGNVEIEVGRVDFYDLPAFQDNEVELTRKYLNKNHSFRMGEKEIPRRALVENNFSSFDEAFGQSAWRSYVPLFGPGKVETGNYDVQLDTSAWLCSYACGGGSYTSAGGIGNTANLWAAKEIKTVFTMIFGSYFGDWDSQNNFLRSALASGDVLSNAWAGRPVWHFFPMALGKHIGYCTRFTQNASSGHFEQGYGAHSTHIGLMGDPTLRLHPIKTPTDLIAEYQDGNIELSWLESPEAKNGYVVYRRADEGEWTILADKLESISWIDECILPEHFYEYMVKALRLEQTGSGSYYNTSLGIKTGILVDENPMVNSYYADADKDGYGDPDNFTLSCLQPPDFVLNMLDCDDSNPDINPDAEEIADNGIDEDCDGKDLLTTIEEESTEKISIFPNPVLQRLYFEQQGLSKLTYLLSASNGILISSGEINRSIDMSSYNPGIYLLEIKDEKGNTLLMERIVLLE